MLEKCQCCAHSGKDCIPHLMALAATDLIAWCKERKKKLDLSNAEIAERSNIPKGTVDRLFGKEEFTEFRFSTIQPIIRVLVGCKLEDLDCAEPVCADKNLLDTIEKQRQHIEALEKENAYLSRQEERYASEYKEKHKEYHENIESLNALCKIRLKAIFILAAALAACIGILIAA